MQCSYLRLSAIAATDRLQGQGDEVSAQNIERIKEDTVVYYGLKWQIVYIAWCAQVSSLHFQVYHQQNNMFALKQISLMALLIASAYAAPQLDLEENARNINTEDYINVRDHP